MRTPVQLVDQVNALLFSWLCPHCHKACRSQIRTGTRFKTVRCGHCKHSVELTGLPQFAGLPDAEIARLIASSCTPKAAPAPAPPKHPGSGLPRRPSRAAGRARRLARRNKP